jgi:hypothetical protein
LLDYIVQLQERVDAEELGEGGLHNEEGSIQVPGLGGRKEAQLLVRREQQVTAARDLDLAEIEWGEVFFRDL